MATYIVRQAFLAFTVGQVVYSDADATGKPAGSVVTDAQVAGHTASLVTVSSSGGGSSTGTGTSTGGTSTTGTGTSTGGTSTTGTGTGTGGNTAPAATYVTSFVRNSDGSTTFSSNDGTMLTVPASAPLTTAQAATLASVGSIVNTAGQVTAPVVGDVSGATIGTTTIATAVSTIGSHTAHFLTIDSSLTSMAGSQSATGTTVAANTALLGTHSAQIGTLATGLQSAGAAASAAGTLAQAASSSASTAGSVAASAGNSVSTLGAQVGTLASAVAPLGGQLGTLSSGVSAAGSVASAAGTLAAAASTTATAAASSAGSATAAVSSLSSTVSNNTSLLASHGTSLSSLGTQVAQAAPITGQSSANGTISLLSTTGTVTKVLATIPPGTLGSGSVGGNTAAPLAGGPDRPLSAVLGDRVSMTSYGSTQSNNRVSDPVSNGGLNINTRAALAAYKNSAGQTPYAFMATQPTPNATSSGTDEYEFFVPAAVAAVASGSTQTVPLAAAYTTAGALFQSAIDKHWYIPMGMDAGHTFVPDQAVAHPSLAAGTVILATHQSTIMVSDQPAGTTLASGASVAVGADMTKIKVGQQVWSTQGVVPFTTVTAISGLIATFSTPLVSATDPYNRTTNGLFQLQLCRVFTPTPETSLCGAITMDDLSFMAGYWNAPVAQHGGFVELHPGDYIFAMPKYLWGRSVSIIGPDNNSTFFRSVNGCLDMIFICPTPYVRCSYRNFSFDPYNGLSRSDLHVYGAGYDVPTPNVTSNSGDFENVQGLTSNNIGAKQHVRLRHVSGVFAKNCTHQGYGYAAPDSCTFSLGGCVAFYSTTCASTNCESTFLAEGYNEHLLMVDSAQVQSGWRYKGDKGSTLGGVALLIFEMRGGDADNHFGNDLVVLALGVVIGPGTVQFTNSTTGTTATPANAGVLMRGCAYGWVGGLTGGAVGGVNADCVQGGPAQIDTGTANTQYVTFESINANSYKSALRLLPGATNNFVANTVMLYNGTGSYGFDTVNSVINQGAGNYVEPWPASR